MYIHTFLGLLLKLLAKPVPHSLGPIAPQAAVTPHVFRANAKRPNLDLPATHAAGGSPAADCYGAR